MLADLAEEAVLNGIPLGGAGRVVADGHPQLKAVDQFFLQGTFPEATPGAVAAAAVGQDEQLRRLPVTSPALLAPPLHDGIDRKLRRVVRSANQYGAPIGRQIIKTAGNGHAFGLRAKIVVVDRKRLFTPDAALILERSHQFFLLGVHADNGQGLAAERLALDLEVTELTVALRALRAGKTFAIGVQRVAQLVQQTSHGVRDRPKGPSASTGR